jgi:hypothetical protein
MFPKRKKTPLIDVPLHGCGSRGECCEINESEKIPGPLLKSANSQNIFSESKTDQNLAKNFRLRVLGKTHYIPYAKIFFLSSEDCLG